MGAPARSRPPGIVRAYIQHGMQTLPQPVKLTTDRADVPLRPAPGRALPPVLAVRRRGDRRPRARRSTPRSSSSAHRFYAEVGRRRASRSWSTRSATRPAGPAYIAELTAYYRGHVADAAGDRARPARAQRPAAARLQGPGDDGAQRGRAADHRPAVRGLRRALRGRQGPPRRARHAVPRRAAASSAASTTTRGPRSSSTSRAARASSRRWAAAAATTASSSCSAASRRRGSGSGWASTGSRSCSAEQGSARAAPSRPARGRRRRGS